MRQPLFRGTDGARTHDLPHVKRTLIPAELRFHILFVAILSDLAFRVPLYIITLPLNCQLIFLKIFRCHLNQQRKR